MKKYYILVIVAIGCSMLVKNFTGIGEILRDLPWWKDALFYPSQWFLGISMFLALKKWDGEE